MTRLAWIVFAAALLAAITGCTTTAVLHESTPVRVAARPPAPPPPPPPEPEPPPRVEVEETRIRVDEKIHFELDSDEISSVSDGLLQEIARVMNDNPRLRKIRIEGHTDNQGAAAYNDGLSRRRAESVVARLVQYGVAAERLEAEGYGFARPVADNATEAGRAQNRRVEFNIIEQDAADAPDAAGAAGAGEPEAAAEGGAQ
jgi:OOP family OmpA-OmpF porin